MTSHQALIAWASQESTWKLSARSQARALGLNLGSVYRYRSQVRHELSELVEVPAEERVSYLTFWWGIPAVLAERIVEMWSK
jgi:hypothetical protein